MEERLYIIDFFPYALFKVPDGVNVGEYIVEHWDELVRKAIESFSDCDYTYARL